MASPPKKKNSKKATKAKNGWRKTLMANQAALLMGILAVFIGIAVGMTIASLGGDRRESGDSKVATKIDLPKITPMPTPGEALEKMTAEGFTLGEPDGEPPVVSTEYGEAVYQEEILPDTLRISAETAAKKDESQQAALPRPVPLRERVGKDAAPIWLRNAVAASAPDGRAMIAIVVDDLGMNRRRTARTVAFKPPLTLAFLPYASDLPEQTWKAREAGHELVVHVPMEPLDGTFDPGIMVLTTDLDTRENKRNLAWNLDRFTGYVGINNHMGSKFTADRKGMRAVMEEIKKRELLYLDSRTTNKTQGPRLARELNIPYAERHVFLDNVVSYNAVRERLKDLEDIARRQGFAIGICHPHDATLDALSGWFNTLDESKFAIVPLSAVVLRRMELSGMAG